VEDLQSSPGEMEAGCRLCIEVRGAWVSLVHRRRRRRDLAGSRFLEVRDGLWSCGAPPSYRGRWTGGIREVGLACLAVVL
jgi:hypothetical protein